MSFKNSLVSIVLTLLLLACGKESKAPIDYVDPMIGTDGIGHTFPGATVPFGMVQLSPSNHFKSWNWCSGYHYSDSILKGFAHTHISGAGLAALGDILLMPTTGEVFLEPGTDDNPDIGYRSRFSHDEEEATPGYYSVMLSDYGVKVELTTSERVGYHRYTPNKGGVLNVIIDPTHNIMERVMDTGIEYISETEMRGYKKCDGEGGERTVYFYAKFSKPIVNYGLAKDHEVISEAQNVAGEDTRAFVQVELLPKEALEVQVSLSFVSYKGAKANFDAEAAGKTFDDIYRKARLSWSEKLDKIQVEGNSESDLRVFHTAMYHSFISPNLISDVDGKYVVEGKVLSSDIPQYSNYSTWDTYRALHPLFTIIDQEKTSEFVNSLTSRHFEAQVGLPVWECLGHDNVCMIGYNTVSPMVDAVLKDIDGIDADKVYEAVRAAAMSLEKHSPNYDKNGMEEYIQLGFVPAELNCAVSKTTEQNYYDWCIAMLAEKLGRKEDAELFLQRSIGYRNLYNPEAQFLYSKYTTGEWRQMDMTVWDDLIGNYVSGNIWGYSSYVPHDVEGLIELIGGREKFALWLDRIFTDTTTIVGDTHVDISGFIGKYGHGDEPSHHMPYLYNYAAEPWKTQEYVRKVMSDFYQDTPDGMVNNDDLGQMSAWYIFSAMGFYPVCPGDMQYALGSPLLKKVTLKLNDNKMFTVVANNTSAKNKYVQSVRLNGKPYSKSFITHQQIMDGGNLIFEMGDKPNKNWGVDIDAIPVSKVNIKRGGQEHSVTFKPFDKNTEEVFDGSRAIALSCNTDDAQIYYTLDGSVPDTNSKKYQKPIHIRNTTRLRAIAVKQGLQPSFMYDRTYFRGRHFNELAAKPKLVVSQSTGGYGAKDGSQVFDLQMGSDHYADGRWTSWIGKDMIATIDFGEDIRFNTVSIGFLSNTGVWIFPPKSITVWVSNNNIDFTILATQNIDYSYDVLQEKFVDRKTLKLNGKSGRYLKVQAENFGLLPKWHGGSSSPSLMFIDEILVN